MLKRDLELAQSAPGPHTPPQATAGPASQHPVTALVKSEKPEKCEKSERAAPATVGRERVGRTPASKHRDKDKEKERDQHAKDSKEDPKKAARDAKAAREKSEKDAEKDKNEKRDQLAEEAASGVPRVGAFLKHVLHVTLVSGDPAVSHILVERVGALMQAICVRSVEGRKRILSELVSALSHSSGTATAAAGTSQGGSPPLATSVRAVAVSAAAAGVGALDASPYIQQPGLPEPHKVCGRCICMCACQTTDYVYEGTRSVPSVAVDVL